MHTPGMMEKVGKCQQDDRLREAELARFSRKNQLKNRSKVKTIVLLSGVSIVMLTIIQLI